MLYIFTFHSDLNINKNMSDMSTQYSLYSSYWASAGSRRRISTDPMIILEKRFLAAVDCNGADDSLIEPYLAIFL